LLREKWNTFKTPFLVLALLALRALRALRHAGHRALFGIFGLDTKHYLDRRQLTVHISLRRDRCLPHE